MDLRDAFDRYLGAGRPAYLDKRRIDDPRGDRPGASLWRDRGARASRAGRKPGAARRHLPAMGLDGVEVIHPSHSAEDRARLLALTSHLDVGSERRIGFTRGRRAIRVVGAMKVPGEWLDLQRARARCGAPRVGLVRCLTRTGQSTSRAGDRRSTSRRSRARGWTGARRVRHRACTFTRRGQWSTKPCGSSRRPARKATLFQADLTRPDEPGRWFATCVASFGRLDVVVNSAAVMLRMPFGNVTAADWDSVLNLNLRAPFLIAQEACTSPS